MSQYSNFNSAEAFEEPEPAFWYYYDLLQLSCKYANEATDRGRYGAAQGLFQTAVLFFERAQDFAVRMAADAHLEELTQMRNAMNSCCLRVYPTGHWDDSLWIRDN